ncbi:MAG: hypothetical protein KKB13_11995, partial [Chloroflexi bacterium]|nr:hypothetical protein [Chloroflexota bacterium]
MFEPHPATLSEHPRPQFSALTTDDLSGIMTAPAMTQPRAGQSSPAGERQPVAILCHFEGSVGDYQATFAMWVVVARPERCPHCGGEHTCVLWATYQRWVYTTTHRVRIGIQRVRCQACGVTDALLPSFLHLFRRYLLALIQQAILLALDRGRWGLALADAIGPYAEPAATTVWGWVWAYANSALNWLLAWLQRTLTALAPRTNLDLGPLPAHLRAIRSPRRRAAFTAGWQALRLAEVLYAAVRARQPDLAFSATQLLAFVAAILGVAGR